MTKKIIGKACKHAFQAFNKYNRDHDLLTAKITTYFDDGSEESKLVFKEDVKRPFYVVLPKYRTFEDKRDYIEINKTKKFMSNQARLAYNISKVLYGRPDPRATLDEMKNSQYLFGCQESLPVVFKQYFYDHYNEFQTKASYSIAAYDIETDIVDVGVGPINMASVTSEEKVYFNGVRKFFPHKTDREILENLKLAEEKYLSKEYMKKHNVKIVYGLSDNPGECAAEVIKRFHIFNPDWVVSWNANFDMANSIKAMQQYGLDDVQIFSDPSVPDAYKHYNYYPGREYKKKVTGASSPLENQERFPTLIGTAGWQWLDGMSFYAISRVGKGKLDSYALQATAEREKVFGKLYVEEGGHLKEGSPDWHKYMQKHHPYIYAMYNINDNWVIEELNRATQDYSLALPSLITSSELTSYQSQPTLISDELSFIALKHGYVWGTVGRMKKDKFKDIKPDLKDWIALLHAEMNELNGRCLYKGLPSWVSLAHGPTDDVDVSSGYPSASIAMGVSNKTTKVEVCQIEGFDRYDFRRLGVNYASSPTANATTLATSLYGLPDLFEMKNFYLETVLPAIKK